MLKYFKYTKESGEESDRVVYPLHLVDDKMLSIDLTPFSDAERIIKANKLDEIHKEYLKMVREAGFGDRYRMFFLKQMS